MPPNWPYEFVDPNSYVFFLKNSENLNYQFECFFSKISKSLIPNSYVIFSKIPKFVLQFVSALPTPPHPTLRELFFYFFLALIQSFAIFETQPKRFQLLLTGRLSFPWIQKICFFCVGATKSTQNRSSIRKVGSFESVTGSLPSLPTHSATLQGFSSAQSRMNLIPMQYKQ